MQFFPKYQKVEAQQFTSPSHPELVTLVQIQRITDTRFCYWSPKHANSFPISIRDWVIKWEDGTIQILSSHDFESRFQQEDEVKNLKATIDYLSKKFQELR